MKVLIADDDREQLSLRGMLLRQNGIETIEAGDEVSAVELAMSQHPDCAIIDLRLPTEELGLRLIRELKALNSAHARVRAYGPRSSPLGSISGKPSG